MENVTGLITNVTSKNTETISVSLTYDYDPDLYETLSKLRVDSEELKKGSTAGKQIVIRKAKPGERTGQLDIEE